MDGSRSPASSSGQHEHAEVLTGAERLVRCLEQHGVEYIFGLSGGAAMPIFDALVDSQDQADPDPPRAGRDATWPTATRARPAGPASCS